MSEDRTLAFAMAELHPDEAAGFLETCTPAATAEFLTALPPAIAASVAARIAPAHAAAAVAGIDADAARLLVADMPPNAATSVLRRMPQTQRDLIVGGLSQTRQVQLRLLLRQPPRSVGAWMDSTVQPVRLGLSAGEARTIAATRTSDSTHLYVTDAEQTYLGSVALSVLHGVEDAVLVERLYIPGGTALRAGATLDEAVGNESWNALDEMPVVDRHGKFVGSIRYAVLRSATMPAADTETDRAEEREDGSIMELADMCYVGMARIMAGAISHRRGTAPDGSSDS